MQCSEQTCDSIDTDHGFHDAETETYKVRSVRHLTSSKYTTSCNITNLVSIVQVSDGIDCLILTGETGVGPYWKEATEFMARICYEAEQNQKYEVKYNIK